MLTPAPWLFACVSTCTSGAPAPGTNPLSVEAPTPGCYAGVRRFEELPLSRYTKDGLKEGKFVKLTAIQVCEGVGGGQGWEEVGGRRYAVGGVGWGCLLKGKFVKLAAIQVCERVGGRQGWEEVGVRREVGWGGMSAEGKARQADGH